MSIWISRELEELEAIREAQEAALRQAEIAAQEAAVNLNIFEEEDLFDVDDERDADSLNTNTDDENHVTTPSTRSLSREKSPGEDTEKSHSSSFRNPTQPLEATKPPSFENGMTHSAVLRHVSSFKPFLTASNVVSRL